MPVLIGGRKGLWKRIEYPPTARNAGIQGKVTLKFIVNKEGKAENIKVVTGISPECDKAAIRALRHSNFIPAEYLNTPVNMAFAFSVYFRI
ncbi:MAG: energy transducer TonB [Balneolaceae bacterium]|nr:energy transducer TonB [Balneolaceae bacterium]